jgi:DNA invertase Pin-like site-specific DNA recombinase
MQRGAIEDFARVRGLDVVKWYVDKGESGAKLFRDRPSAQRLLSELAVFKPDCILAWSIDRIGRNMLDTMSTILELENRGVRVVTVREEFLQSLDPHIRKLIISVFAWVAEYERRRMRERQEEAWRHGKQKGRPKKVPDDVVLKYYSETRSARRTWELLLQQGYSVTLDAVKKRVRKLVKQGLVQPVSPDGSSSAVLGV